MVPNKLNAKQNSCRRIVGVPTRTNLVSSPPVFSRYFQSHGRSKVFSDTYRARVSRFPLFFFFFFSINIFMVDLLWSSDCWNGSCWHKQFNYLSTNLFENFDHATIFLAADNIYIYIYFLGLSAVIQQRKVVINSHGEKLEGILHDTGSKELVILCHGIHSSKVSFLLPLTLKLKFLT